MKKHVLAVLLVGLFAAGLWAQEAAPLEVTKGLKYDAIKKGAEYAVSLGALEISSNSDDFVLVIPAQYKGKPVSAVAAKGFKGANIRKVVFPDSITSIGDSAFEGCSLREVTIPGSVKEIGASAFAHANLSTLTLNEGLVTIGANAFEMNYLDGALVFPKSLTKIGDAAFLGDKSNGFNKYITAVTFNSDTLAIGDVAFAKCDLLETVTFNGKVTDIGVGAFALTRIKELVLPEGLTKLRFALAISNSLTKIVLPSTLKEMSSATFPAVSPETVQFLSKVPPKVTAPTATDGPTVFDKSHEMIGNFGDLSRFKVISNKNLKSVIVPKGAEATYGDAAVWGDYADWITPAE